GFDDVQFLVPNNRSGVRPGEGYHLNLPDGGPTAGSTSFSRSVAWQGGELFEGTKGDVMCIAQYRYNIVNTSGIDAGFIVSYRPAATSYPSSGTDWQNALNNNVSAAFVVATPAN